MNPSEPNLQEGQLPSAEVPKVEEQPNPSGKLSQETIPISKPTPEVASPQARVMPVSEKTINPQPATPLEPELSDEQKRNEIEKLVNTNPETMDPADLANEINRLQE